MNVEHSPKIPAGEEKATTTTFKLQEEFGPNSTVLSDIRENQWGRGGGTNEINGYAI